MKYVIDEDVCKNFDVSIEEVLFGLLYKYTNNLEVIQDSLLKRGYLELHTNEEREYFKLSKEFDTNLTAILLKSDKSVPNTHRCETLAIRLRALFPKGSNAGGYPWRGNIRDITLKLQKFFKLYGSEWSDDEIIEATQRYISHFNGDYTTMRLLKYFIMKSDKVAHEDISDLATWLENDTEESYNNDWTIEIR